MKMMISVLCFASTLLLCGPAFAGELYLNFFRNPSIGPEYRVKYFSTHIGYYPTILSPNEDEKKETTGFLRTGITAWPVPWLYASVSHLHGLTGKWRNRNEILLEAGVQGLILDERIALRFGIAVLPSVDHGTKVNPTPGISLRIPL